MLIAILLVQIAAQDLTPSAQVENGTRFGRSVLALSDLDGDGVPEIAVGAPAALSGDERPVWHAGRILVLSGASREVLQSWSGEKARSLFGHSMVAAGDANGDGVTDVLVGYESQARSEVRSGLDGELLIAFDVHASSVAPLGDYDKDGTSDFLLTSHCLWEIRSGRDGRFLAAKDLFVESSGQFHSIGDVDGDGLIDGIAAGVNSRLLLSAAQDDPSTRLYEPDSPLRVTWPFLFDDKSTIAWFAASAGDLDGDGHSDVLLSVARESESRLYALSLKKNPGAVLFSVGDAPPMGDRNDRVWGKQILAHIDIDGDAVDDVIFGSPTFLGAATIQARLGKSHRQAWSRRLPAGGASTGPSLARFPDQDGDGVEDVLVGSSDWFWHGAVHRDGMLRLVSGSTGDDIWKLSETAVPELSPR